MTAAAALDVIRVDRPAGDRRDRVLELGRFVQPVGVQGNLDPFVLTTTPAVVTEETERLLCDMRGVPGHIFNLGHGVPPNAKLENIQTMMDTIRSFV